MKQKIFKTTSLIVTTLFMFSFLQAQDEINKNYTWENESDKITIQMDVKKDADVLSMAFSGNVKKGNLVVYAYDPDGNKECGFCLITDCSLSCGSKTDSSKGISSSSRSSNSNSNSSTSSNTNDGVKTTTTTTTSTGDGYTYASSSSMDNSGAKGNAVETISDPVAGTWKFVIEAIEVTGQLEVQINQD